MKPYKPYEFDSRSGAYTPRRLAIARQLEDIGRLLGVFVFGGELYVSRTVDEAMGEADGE